ncbi:class I SAM-dependent methyltransferase, partial [Shewanella sp. C31]|nr:class I SAM-dependent methyltransferase [Shewanella electrica]
KEARLRRFPPGEIARKALEGLEAKSVLDIGTGTGVFAEAFAALGLFTVGLDPRADRLEVARAKVKGARFVEGRAEALPFPEGSFDLAFFGLSLHHLDPIAALREASRGARRLGVLEGP